MAFSAEDIRWMHAALSLSRRGLGQVWPNPSVGCIIVKHGIVLGRGVTAAGGRPHAEAAALVQAGAAAHGATAYVTLEPCGRPGRDQSCADKLIAAGVARVVAAVTDPNPAVNGHGLDQLRRAGIAVECGLLEGEARASHAGFFNRITLNRPLVTLKLATSLDGKIATSTGESRWITGPEARRFGHMLRARHDAVMIGIGTAMSDDPMLDVRDLGHLGGPVRIVLDTELNIPAGSQLVQTARQQPLWLLHGQVTDSTKAQILEQFGARTFACNRQKDGRLDLPAALQSLAQQGLTRILCEGGARLAAALIKADLVDRLALFGAGLVIGADGISAIGRLDRPGLPDVPRFDLMTVQRIGSDTFSHWHRSAPLP